MRFDITDEQKSLRDMLTAFFDERYGGAQGVEAIEREDLDPDLWAAISELGLAGAMVPEADGGLGLDLLTAAVIAEVLGRYAVPAPVIPAILAAWLVAVAGNDAQRAKWLPRLLHAGARPAFAFAEAGGWEPGSWTLGDRPLSGSKKNVERAGDADLFLVGTLNGEIAIVEPEGVELTPLDTLDRTRPLFDISFAGAEADVVSTDPEIARRLFDALCICAAADALGAASALQARAVEYAKERRQYGQLIGSFQALKHQLADMSVELEPARPLIWYAAYAWDTGQTDAPRMARLAKSHVGEVAVAASRAAIEAHGGIGYTWEHPAHLFLKRSMHDRGIFGGTAIHREQAAMLAGW